MKLQLFYIFLLLVISLSFSSSDCGSNCIESDDILKCYQFIECDNTTCVYEERDLDDGVACTIDSCDDVLGEDHSPDDSLCPPENLCYSYYCHEEAGCLALSKVNCPLPNNCQIPLGCNRKTGQCGYIPINCDDDNECTIDTCDPNQSNNSCVHTPNDSYCADQMNGSICYSNAKCGKYGCEYDELNCTDNNPCSDDYCDFDTGCYSELNDFNCFSSNQCFDNKCTANGCVQIPIDCDDGNPCSVDSCDPSTGCFSTLNNTLCNTGNKCLNSTCTANGCSSTPIVCNDGNPCSDDSCNTSTGCKFILNDSNCNDGNKCTIDTCGSNGCTHTNVTCPPQHIIGSLLCRSTYCDQSTGNCVPDMGSLLIIC
ncbi:hypothetical protein ACTA71_000725 [Dictyostelium dimigraforme]